MSWTPSAIAGSYLQMGSPLVAIDGVLEIGPLSSGGKPVIDMTPINGTRGIAVVGTPGIITQTLKLAWDPDNTQHAALYAASANGQAAIAFSEVFSNGAIVAYSAYVTKFDLPGGGKSAGAEANVELAVSSAITLTP